MRLNVPFIKSRGFECGQACAAMMIKYYHPDFTPDFDEMNRVIHHLPNKYTFPPQLALLLDHYGVEAHGYSSDDIQTSIDDPTQFKRWWGKDYEHEVKFLDPPSFDWMVETMRAKDLFTLKTTDFAELLAHFDQGHLVSMPIDWATVTGQGGPYQGHFVVISGRVGDNLLIHDPDVEPYQTHPLSLIEEAWHHPAIANDFLVSTGTKQRPA